MSFGHGDGDGPVERPSHEYSAEFGPSHSSGEFEHEKGNRDHSSDNDSEKSERPDSELNILQQKEDFHTAFQNFLRELVAENTCTPTERTQPWVGKDVSMCTPDDRNANDSYAGAANGCGSYTSFFNPDRVWQRVFGADFKTACDIHDTCYDMQLGKDYCDDKFLEDLRGACERIDKLEGACRVMARSYYEAVHHFADRAYQQ